jgi:hypothetical protein
VAVLIGEPILVPCRILFGSKYNLFGFHVEPSVERILHGTQKGSTWNQKGFFKGLSHVDSQRTLKVLDSTLRLKKYILVIDLYYTEIHNYRYECHSPHV